MTPRPQGVPRLPLVLLGLMTVLTLAGPFVLKPIMDGGDHPGLVPDRPIEWFAMVGICGSVAVLMIACLCSGWIASRALRGRKGGAEGPPT